ncbi:hypothetical protein PBNK5_21570 [Pectobacterium brasiliense]
MEPVFLRSDSGFVLSKTHEDRLIVVITAFRAPNYGCSIPALLEPTQRSLAPTMFPVKIQQYFLNKRQMTV